jgi:hypothetical protein
MTSSLKFEIYMTNNNQINKWKNCGLSIDKNSITNAILIDKAIRYPLIVDP